jgi:glycosyltransferase involved in cell wall biosynthesis
MRNEAKNAQECIRSLLVQNNVQRVVAVDDCSSDGTRELLSGLAATDQRVRIVTIDEVPEGWAGKSYACHLGSAEAGMTDWLLFVDADTRLLPGALEKALAYAEGNTLDALSLFGKLRCPNVWDKLATPFYFGLLNAFIPVKAVNDPLKPDAYFVGSFILIRRSKYDEMGGHAAVAADLVEDRALGKLAKEEGLKISLRFSPDDLSAEWAPGFRNSVDALHRVSVPPMRGRARVGAAFSFALSILFLMPLLSVLLGGLMVAEGLGGGALVILLLGIVLLGLELTFTLASAARMSAVSVSFAPGFIPASLVFLAVLWRSVFRAWLMQPVRWRGREYRL